MDSVSPTSPISVPPVAPLPESKSKIWMWIVCGVVLLGGGIVAGVFLGKQLYSKSVPQTTPSPPVTSTQEVTPDSTTNWKTCINSKDGFSIAHPANFDIDSTTCNYGIMDYSLVKDINVSDSLEDFRKNWLLTITAEKTSLDVTQWIKNKCPVSSSRCSELISGPIENSKQYDLLNVHYAETNTVVKINDTIFIFSLNARNPSTPVNPDIRKVYNQILSTFKFLNNSKNTITVKLYYHDLKLDPNTYLCEANNYIEKKIPKTDTPIKDAVNTLIRSDVFEKDDRFILKSINLKQDGTLTLEFPFIGGFTTGGSCRIGILTSQIEKTALQFPEVRKVPFDYEVFQP